MNLFDPSKDKKKKKRKVKTEKTEKTSEKESQEEERKVPEEKSKFVSPFTYDEMLERIKGILTKQNPNLISSSFLSIIQMRSQNSQSSLLRLTE